MRNKFKNWWSTTGKPWCHTHRRALTIIAGMAALAIVIAIAFRTLPAWKVWLAIWAASVIIPPVLGMMGKQIGFRWVVLWECVMFLPVVLILIFFVQDIRNYIIKGGKV